MGGWKAEIVRADETDAVVETLAALVPQGASGGPRPRVLDAGCGAGRMAKALTARGFEVTGIERSPPQAAQARAVCKQVYEGDLQDEGTWARAGGGYDALLLSHVLEHVVEREKVLRLAKAALKPSAALVVVLPNVATWRMRWHLLSGRWEYREEGVLDRTHVRFYTLESAVQFLEEDGQLELARVRLFQIASRRGSLSRKALDLLRDANPLPFTHSFILGAHLRESAHGSNSGG